MTFVPSKINGDRIRAALKTLGIPNEMEEISRVEIGLQYVTVESWDRSSMPPVRITHEYPISWANRGDDGEIIR